MNQTIHTFKCLTQISDFTAVSKNMSNCCLILLVTEMFVLKCNFIIPSVTESI